MVEAVRGGRSLRSVASSFGVSVATVSLWVDRARGQRLDRVDFRDVKPGRAANRLSSKIERRILESRQRLRTSVLGEYGASAIARDLAARYPDQPLPARATIHRALQRHGAVDHARRQRRAPPPKGWYLPDVAQALAELDSLDYIEGLKIADGPLLDVLTATSLHGALADAWPTTRAGSQHAVRCLLERWRSDGLPSYVQFDNDTAFQGAHQFADSVGRVVRLCLALEVTPVFAPPREPGFQNAIEGFNGLWQAKVWQRHQVASLAHLGRLSQAYVAAYRTKTASRADGAPPRRPFPKDFEFDLHAPLFGRVVFLRRSSEAGSLGVLGHTFSVDKHWIRRLVRCEVDFTHGRMRFYALRRPEPAQQPLLREVEYVRPDRPFLGAR
jgi:hypothetical protein